MYSGRLSREKIFMSLAAIVFFREGNILSLKGLLVDLDTTRKVGEY